MNTYESASVLVVDDDHDIVNAIGKLLEKEGFEIYKAYNGLEAIECLMQKEIQLILIDVMMPKLDGLSAMMKIRTMKNIPIIVLSAKSEDSDKILGLSMGADDYITKPYNPMEVVARVKAQLRRNYDYKDTAQPEKTEWKCFDLTLDSEAGTVTKGEQNIELTKTEFRLLEILMKNQGRILTKQQLFDYAWDGEFIAGDNTIMVHISNLRNKIEENSKEPRILKTIKGLGYKIERE